MRKRNIHAIPLGFLLKLKAMRRKEQLKKIEKVRGWVRIDAGGAVWR